MAKFFSISAFGTDEMNNQPTIRFSDNRDIPQLRLGVWQVADDVAAGTVESAIRSGYRHIDTAVIYENEVGVGRGVHASGIVRGDIFVTTKLF